MDNTVLSCTYCRGVMVSINSDFYTQPQPGIHAMGRAAFIFTISLFTALFIVVAMFAALHSYSWQFDSSWKYLGFVIACMVVAIGGGMFAQIIDNPLVSFVCGSICAGAMGLLIGPFVALYEVDSVVQALWLAAGAVLVTGFIGAILPTNLSYLGAPLFALLLGVIFIQFGSVLLAMIGIDMQLTFTLLDWGVLILFCVIMVYDLNMARRLDHTLDNAIDVAVNVFLNFANIFIRILSIMGARK